MKPEIKIAYSTDVKDLEAWKPPDLAAVYFPLQMLIGIEGQSGDEMFQVLVTTPEALRAYKEADFCFPGRHMLVVMNCDWTSIWGKIQEILAKCEGDDWPEIAQRLSRYFRWEFEDYKEYQGDDE